MTHAYMYVLYMYICEYLCMYSGMYVNVYVLNVCDTSFFELHILYVHMYNVHILYVRFFSFTRTYVRICTNNIRTYVHAHIYLHAWLTRLHPSCVWLSQ